MRYFWPVLQILVLTAELGAQPTIAPSNGRGRTLDEALRGHNIELTQSALVDALKNADPEIRYLAAQKLAESKKRDAIPAIVAAFTSEKAPLTRVNIAFALAQLSDATGFGALEDGCSKGRLDPQTSVLSGQYLIDLRHESLPCLNALLDIVQFESDSDGYRIQAASILPRFHELSPVDSGRILAGLLKALETSNPAVRMAASDALADLGNSAAIPALRKTAENERDEVVRAHFERDLLRLQSKHQP